jgi:hypothetical protein
MRTPSAKPLPAFTAYQRLLCLATGGVLGQMVMGIAARHNGSALGLSYALVLVLSGAASLALLLKHLHLERQPRGKPAPMQTWLLMLSSGVLGSIYAGPLLG